MKKAKEYLTNFFNGFMMALADSVPGVSGGSIAFILGFYDNFVGALDSLLYKEKRKDGLLYLLKLGIGWIVGMALSVLILTKVFETNIYQISSLFIGFILLSIPIIIKDEKKSLKENIFNIIFTLIGIALVVAITYFNNTQLTTMSLTKLTLSHGIYIFLVGMIAISAMILPGISGSTMLLIFGIYIPIMNNIKAFMHFDFSVIPSLVIFGLGIIAGLMAFAKVARKCLEKHRSQTVYAILGLMIGSIYSIIIGPATLETPQPAMNFSNFSMVFFIIGGAVIAGLELLKRGLNKKS